MIRRVLQPLVIACTALLFSLAALTAFAEERSSGALALLARVTPPASEMSRKLNGTLILNGAEFAYATRSSALSPERALESFERTLGVNARCMRETHRAHRLTVCLVPPAPLGLEDVKLMLETRDLTRLGPFHAALASEGKQGSTLLMLASERIPLRELFEPDKALSARPFDSTPFDIATGEPILVVAQRSWGKDSLLLAATRKPLWGSAPAPPRPFRTQDGDPSPWLYWKASGSNLYFAARLPNGP